VFEGLGAIVEPVVAPHPSEAIWDSWITLRSWAHAAGLQPIWNDPEMRKRIKEDAAWEIERGMGFSAMALHAASVAASDWFRRAAELFQTYDALVLPTCQVWPFASDVIWPDEINGTKMDTYHCWMEVTIPVSLIGVPAVSLPVGFCDAGLPMGMQIFGSRGADLKLLQMAESYHQATDWPNARPPLLG
jgi:amidase